MATRFCYSCGEDAILEVDGAAGNSVCTVCGTVLEENAIVSEITFGETSGGAAMVQGSHVGADQTRARAPAGYRQKGGSQESREQTMLNGRRRIQALATALRLPDRLSDAGQRYFNLAVNMNFVQGRRTQYVVAACLYSACRMDKTSHMLIDFSDLLEINVFVLGATYLKLTKELNLHLPNVDPSIYISRFAALLEFGDETEKVAQDAIRLVARMGRDWMHIGRRPSGVCGACLLLAARMNNFRRSIAEVVQVVKIADVTLRKRLEEFRDTASGGLTVDDFRTLWLDETADPPSFAKNQKREKEEREKRLRSESVLEGSEMGEGEGEERRREAFKELKNASSPGPDGLLRDGVRGDGADQEGDAEEEPLIPSAKSLGKRKRVLNDEDDEDDGGGGIHPDKDPDGDEDDPVYHSDPDLDLAIEAELSETLTSDTGKVLTLELDKAEVRRFDSAAKMTNLNESERLDDLDEDELDCFILTPAEAEAKSRLWMENNREYLQALADKQTGPDGELRPEAKRRIRKKHRPRDSQTAQGVDAADATKQLFAKKKFSKKINYAAIDNLFGKSEANSDDDEPVDSDDDAASSVGGASVASRSRAGTPRLGTPRSRAGTPNGIRRGTPIHIPRPTFSRGQSGTPLRQSSEAPQTPTSVIAPLPGAARKRAALASAVAGEEEEEEEGDMAPPARKLTKVPVQHEEEEDWRKALGGFSHNDDEEEDYGWGDEV